MKFEEFRKKMENPWWRINNLYQCKNKEGEVVPFFCWEEQAELYHGMSLRNVILKSRQVGMTTFIQIYMLDTALFNSNTNVGVVAHNRDDAQAFFRDKIKFAYENLHEDLKEAIPARNDAAGELGFANGSHIRVATSLRGSTLQIAHISEYGHICAYRPEKAREVKTGTLNTISPKSICFIESTMEQPIGHFYDICVEAEKQAGNIGPLDYKFWFFPWWRRDEYTVDTPRDIGPEDANYFKELDLKHGIKLSERQKWWYISKKKEQGDEVFKQFPSIPEEAYRVILENAVYGKEMRTAWKEGRISKVPHIPRLPVNVFFDIGRDMTAMVFHQADGLIHRIINYVEAENENLDWIANVLQKDFPEYTYGKFYFPHDIDNVDLSQSRKLTRKQILQELGVNPIKVVERVKSLDDGIAATRFLVKSCWFDEVKCKRLVMCLENYRYERHKTTGVLSREPVHNWASHGCDAFRQIAQGFKPSSKILKLDTLKRRRFGL